MFKEQLSSALSSFLIHSLSLEFPFTHSVSPPSFSPTISPTAVATLPSHTPLPVKFKNLKFYVQACLILIRLSVHVFTRQIIGLWYNTAIYLSIYLVPACQSFYVIQWIQYALSVYVYVCACMYHSLNYTWLCKGARMSVQTAFQLLLQGWCCGLRLM